MCVCVCIYKLILIFLFSGPGDSIYNLIHARHVSENYILKPFKCTYFETVFQVA